MAAQPYRHVIDMPSVTTIVRRAGSTVLIASVIPMGVFYLVLAVAGLRPAVGVTMAWYYGGLLLRVLQKRPVLGASLLGAGLITLRTVVAFWTGSTYLYFLQPVAGTVLTATSLAVTGLAGRPLLERLAHDFCPIPVPLGDRLRANGFFRHASWVWAVMYFGNAAGTVWLLTSSSLGGFLILKTLMSPVLTGLALGASYLLLRRVMGRDGLQIRWGCPAAVGPVAVPALVPAA